MLIGSYCKVGKVFMDDLPLVTIAIPTYNRIKYLKQALASAMAQTYSNIEIVVLDNASTDGTKEFLGKINDARLKVIYRKENVGSVENMCQSLYESTGKYILILSDDDVIDEKIIEVAISDIKNEKISFWFCSAEIINSEGKFLGKIKASSKRSDALMHLCDWLTGKTSIPFCATLYNVEAVKKAGGFPKTPVLDAAARILTLKHGDALSNIQILSKYRKHSSSATEKMNVESWFNSIEYLIKLIFKTFPEYERQLKPLSLKYSVRMTLSTLPIGNWRAFFRAQVLLLKKYGWRVLLQGKIFRVVIEFIFPQMVAKAKILYARK
jgi:glycosyltransferase involved in cell wall biosynthesis